MNCKLTAPASCGTSWWQSTTCYRTWFLNIRPLEGSAYEDWGMYKFRAFLPTSATFLRTSHKIKILHTRFRDQECFVMGVDVVRPCVDATVAFCPRLIWRWGRLVIQCIYCMQRKCARRMRTVQGLPESSSMNVQGVVIGIWWSVDLKQPLV